MVVDGCRPPRRLVRIGLIKRLDQRAARIPRARGNYLYVLIAPPCAIVGRPQHENY